MKIFFVLLETVYCMDYCTVRISCTCIFDFTEYFGYASEMWSISFSIFFSFVTFNSARSIYNQSVGAYTTANDMIWYGEENVNLEKHFHLVRYLFIIHLRTMYSVIWIFQNILSTGDRSKRRCEIVKQSPGKIVVKRSH